MHARVNSLEVFPEILDIRDIYEGRLALPREREERKSRSDFLLFIVVIMGVYEGEQSRGISGNSRNQGYLRGATCPAALAWIPSLHRNE